MAHYQLKKKFLSQFIHEKHNNLHSDVQSFNTVQSTDEDRNFNSQITGSYTDKLNFQDVANKCLEPCNSLDNNYNASHKSLNPTFTHSNIDNIQNNEFSANYLTNRIPLNSEIICHSSQSLSDDCFHNEHFNDDTSWTHHNTSNYNDNVMRLSNCLHSMPRASTNSDDLSESSSQMTGYLSPSEEMAVLQIKEENEMDYSTEYSKIDNTSFTSNIGNRIYQLPPMVTSSGRNKGCGKLLEPQHACQICGDIAAGFHCGAYVCEACKKFFLRCLKTGRGLSFLCPKNNDCDITKETRSHCQRCRFQRCLDLSMYKPGREDDKKLKIDFRAIPCKVCRAPSSGFHFGAITCEGCKGFFRRMLKEQLHRKFVCSNEKKCNIDSANRTTCKSCRFSKCLKIGMTLEGTRLGRQSNSVKRGVIIQCLPGVRHHLQERSASVDETIHDDSLINNNFMSLRRINSSDTPCSYEDDEFIMPKNLTCNVSQSPSLINQSDIVQENSLLINEIPCCSNSKINNLIKEYKASNSNIPNYESSFKHFFKSKYNEHNFVETKSDGKFDDNRLISSKNVNFDNMNLVYNNLPYALYKSALIKNDNFYQSKKISKHGSIMSNKDVLLPIQYNSEVNMDKSSEIFNLTSKIFKITQKLDAQDNELCNSLLIKDENLSNDYSSNQQCYQTIEYKWEYLKELSLFDLIKEIKSEVKNEVKVDHQICKQPKEFIGQLISAYEELQTIWIRSSELEDLLFCPATINTIWRLVEIPFFHLVRAILKFAQLLPGFNELSSPITLEGCRGAIYPLWLLNQATMPIEQDGEFGFFAATTKERDLVLTYLPSLSAIATHQRIIKFVLQSLQMTVDEVAFLAAMVILTTPDGSNFDPCDMLIELQEEYLDAFLSFQKQEKKTVSARSATLLVRLGELRRANIELQQVASQIQQSYPEIKTAQLWKDVFLK